MPDKRTALKKTRCLVCNSVLDVEEARSIKVTAKYRYAICPICGAGLLLPKLVESELKKLYKSEKYYQGLSKGVQNPLVQWLITKKLYKEPYEWVRDNFKQGKILDVGCGNGEFLFHLKEEGWRVWGSDVSVVAKKNAEAKIGKNKVRLGFFHKQKFAENFNYISFWHVLEHVESPGKYIDKAHFQQKKGGRVLGEVPNFDSLAFFLFKENYAWIMVPVHILYFSRKSLRLLLENSGYKNIQIYSPPRALMNYSLSFDKLLAKNNILRHLRFLVFFLSVPISIVCILLSSSIGKGEVLRFSAIKSE